MGVRPNKGMKLTSVERIGRSQLIPGVRPTKSPPASERRRVDWGKGGLMRTSAAVTLMLTFGVAGAAMAAEQATLAQESVKADKVERLSDGALRATGNVQIVEPTFQLRADSVEMRKTTTSGQPSVELRAEGNVVLMRGEERITLQHLRLNTRTGAGVFQLPDAKK
jgi:lipopolysaccharide assembly outer membrane protein LptD (OstA)